MQTSTRNREALQGVSMSVRRILTPFTPAEPGLPKRGVDCCGLCFEDYDMEKLEKESPHEPLISYRKLAVKQLISLILLSLIVGYFLQPRIVHPITDIRFFDCSNGSESLVVQREEEGETVELCYMKFFSAIGSWVLLLPITVNNISMALYLAKSIGSAWTSPSPGMETMALLAKKGSHEKNEGENGLSLKNRCLYAICAPCIIIFLPFLCGRMLYFICGNLILRRCSGLEPGRTAVCVTVFVALLVILCDTALAVALPFLNYAIIIESSSPSELVVNMVAVQIFANLDGLIVKQMFTPQETLRENIKPFVTPNGPLIRQSAQRPGNESSNLEGFTQTSTQLAPPAGYTAVSDSNTPRIKLGH